MLLHWFVGTNVAAYSWNVKILTVTMGCIGQISAPKDQASFQEIGRIPPSELCVVEVEAREPAESEVCRNL